MRSHNHHCCANRVGGSVRMCDTVAILVQASPHCTESFAHPPTTFALTSSRFTRIRRNPLRVIVGNTQTHRVKRVVSAIERPSTKGWFPLLSGPLRCSGVFSSTPGPLSSVTCVPVRAESAIAIFLCTQRHAVTIPAWISMSFTPFL